MSDKFYMVFVEGERTPTFKHSTLQSAEIEAKRLAKINNKKAFVLATVKSFKISEFIEEDCRILGDSITHGNHGLQYGRVHPVIEAEKHLPF